MGVSRVRRRVIVATICLLALVATGLWVRQRWLTDTTSLVDTSEALDRYRDQQTTATTTVTSESMIPTTVAVARFTVAAPGVYRYATSGSEHIDVLGGATHDYPAETLLTVTPEGCGVRMRWDLLHERWEDMAVCATASGIELQTTFTNYHEFFQHGERHDVQCDRPVLIVPADGEPGDVVPLACLEAGATQLPEWQVLERMTREVGGRQVDVTHVRLTVQDDDEYWEHVQVDYWFDDHGLPVAMTAAKGNRTNSGLVGDVVYGETYSATLISLTPLT